MTRTALASKVFAYLRLQSQMLGTEGKVEVLRGTGYQNLISPYLTSTDTVLYTDSIPGVRTDVSLMEWLGDQSASL